MALASEVLSGISINWKVLSLDILLLAALAILAQSFRSWYRLRAFKGPFLATFSDLWLIRHAMQGRMHLALFDATEKHGILCSLNFSLLMRFANARFRRASCTNWRQYPIDL